MDNFGKAFDAHLPCATCSASHDKESLCPEGGRLYRQMLADCDAAAKKGKTLKKEIELAEKQLAELPARLRDALLAHAELMAQDRNDWADIILTMTPMLNAAMDEGRQQELRDQAPDHERLKANLQELLAEVQGAKADVASRGFKRPEHKPGLERALYLIEYVRGACGDTDMMRIHPVTTATLDRLRTAIMAELENGGPLTSVTM